MGAQKKALKQTWKAKSQASKEAFKQVKAAQKAAKQASKEPAATEAIDTDPALLTFPVEVADGRCLVISWRKGDDINAVASHFAAEHHICSDELGEIVQFLLHAERQAMGGCSVAAAPAAAGVHAEQHAAAVAAAIGAHAASVAAAVPDEAVDNDKMDDAPIPQDVAPVYTTFADVGQMQSLEAMGFTNHELNLQLLTAHEGSLERVLENLL